MGPFFCAILSTKTCTITRRVWPGSPITAPFRCEHMCIILVWERGKEENNPTLLLSHLHACIWVALLRTSKGSYRAWERGKGIEVEERTVTTKRTHQNATKLQQTQRDQSHYIFASPPMRVWYTHTYLREPTFSSTPIRSLTHPPTTQSFYRRNWTTWSSPPTARSATWLSTSTNFTPWATRRLPLRLHPVVVVLVQRVTATAIARTLPCTAAPTRCRPAPAVPQRVGWLRMLLRSWAAPRPRYQEEQNGSKSSTC